MYGIHYNAIEPYQRKVEVRPPLTLNFMFGFYRVRTTNKVRMYRLLLTNVSLHTNLRKYNIFQL